MLKDLPEGFVWHGQIAGTNTLVKRLKCSRIKVNWPSIGHIGIESLPNVAWHVTEQFI